MRIFQPKRWSLFTNEWGSPPLVEREQAISVNNTYIAHMIQSIAYLTSVQTMLRSASLGAPGNKNRNWTIESLYESNGV